MKKLLVVSSVATAAFLATGAASHNAHAAEVSQSEQQLAETALNNPQQLNQAPVQAGAYNIDFVYNGNEFHFESDGSNFSWSYNATSASNSSVQPTQATTTQAAPVQQQSAPVAQQTQSTDSYSAPSQQTQTSQSYNTPSYNYNTTAVSASSVRLSNGNTPGSVGSYAAAQMEKRTGVSRSVWENIIARESNGQVGARNASGASGLFQTMPFHGPTGTVDQQIDSAVKAYNGQGLGAWAASSNGAY